MDPLEQKSKLAVLMELMKSADDAEASKLSPADDSDPGLGDLMGDAGQAKDEAKLDLDGADVAPTAPGDSDMDPAEMQKLMAMYESLK